MKFNYIITMEAGGMSKHVGITGRLRLSTWRRVMKTPYLLLVVGDVDDTEAVVK